MLAATILMRAVLSLTKVHFKNDKEGCEVSSVYFMLKCACAAVGAECTRVSP